MRYERGTIIRRRLRIKKMYVTRSQTSTKDTPRGQYAPDKIRPMVFFFFLFLFRDVLGDFNGNVPVIFFKTCD